MFCLAHAIDPFRRVLMYLDAPDWLRTSQTSAIFLTAHQQANLPSLFQTPVRGASAALLSLIRARDTSALWCMLMSRPALAHSPLDKVRLIYPLHAASGGDEASMTVVKLLLAFRALLEDMDFDGETALHRACANPDIARLLIDSAACINARSKYRALPIHFAAQFGQPEIIRMLLDAKATDLDSGRSFENNRHDGANPLLMAVESRNKMSVDLLLGAGAKAVNAKKNNGISPILLASVHGNVEILKALLKVNEEDLGLPLNVIGDNWTSPLCGACDSGHLATVRLLVDSKATVNAPSPTDGDCCLTAAVREGHSEIVSFLLEAKCVTFNAGYTHPIFTPLYFACSEGRSDIAALLLAAGAGTLPRPRGRTPLASAAGHGHVAVVHTMLAFGTLDPGGQAMAAALDAGHEHICAMLRAGRRFRRRPLVRRPTW